MLFNLKGDKVVSGLSCTNFSFYLFFYYLFAQWLVSPPWVYYNYFRPKPGLCGAVLYYLNLLTTNKMTEATSTIKITGANSIEAAKVLVTFVLAPASWVLVGVGRDCSTCEYTSTITSMAIPIIPAPIMV